MNWQAKKILIRALLLLLTGIFLYGLSYCWRAFPIISGYGAKVIGSAVFIEGRNEQDVLKQELNFFPLGLGRFKVNYADSTVTGSVFGLAGHKAIFRNGLGVTLVNEYSEDAVRARRFRLAVKPLINTDSMAWPMGNKIADTFPADIDKTKLQQALQYGFAERDSSMPIRTRAILVVYNGQIVAEQYAKGFDRNTKLQGWSMTKSITSALTGILVKQGKLNIEAPAPVEEWNDPADPRHAITIKNLLQQSSGLDFVEDYGQPSDATNMLYRKADMAAFTASHKLKDKPGTVFYYSSGNSNILSRIIRNTLGDSLYYAFPYEQLFYRTGMYSAVLEPDASGTFVGSSYMFATARDWARFGLLYLNNGVFNGERILTEKWVSETVSPAPSARQKQYGYQFWLNAGKKYPHAPADMFYANGYEGQSIFIIPSKRLVVVRLGLTQHNNLDLDELLNEIIASIKD